MAGSIDHVLQPDGTYKWEVTELKPKAQETTEATPAPKATKKKVAKKKTDSPLSD
jgi:hypothetical protein|tara:strand:+ start:361 stop:525 length:165 start_codon:yes stop_codon:yes gene_type:complete